MSAKKNLDYVVRVEKEIAKKFGEETIQNPKSGWDAEKEKEYVEQSKIQIAKAIYTLINEEICPELDIDPQQF